MNARTRLLLFLSFTVGVVLADIWTVHHAARQETQIAPAAPFPSISQDANTTLPLSDENTVRQHGPGKDQAALETPVGQSSWFGQVQEGIRKGEYNITRQEKSVDGGPGGLQVANRTDKLRDCFREGGVRNLGIDTVYIAPWQDIGVEFLKYRLLDELLEMSYDNQTPRIIFGPGLKARGSP